MMWCSFNFSLLKTILCKYPTYPSHTLNNLQEHPSRTFNEFKSTEVSDLFHSALNPTFCNLDRTLIQCYATQNLLFLHYYIITLLSYFFSVGLEMKLIYHNTLFLTLVCANNLFYYNFCYETSRLNDST